MSRFASQPDPPPDPPTRHAPTGPEGWTRLHVHRLIIDADQKVPIVVLRSEDSDVFLPIWVGLFEVRAIAMHLESIQPERPLTHDLLAVLLKSLGGKLMRIEINALQTDTYLAHLVVLQADTTLRIDCRPSDAIALALRQEAPIFAADSLLEKAGLRMSADEEDPTEDSLPEDSLPEDNPAQDSLLEEKRPEEKRSEGASKQAGSKATGQSTAHPGANTAKRTAKKTSAAPFFILEEVTETGRPPSPQQRKRWQKLLEGLDEPADDEPLN